MGLGHVCFSTASPAVRTTSTMRSTEPQGFGLSPARVSRRSVMKNSASSSCGSFEISFYTVSTEGNSSPLYSINQSARLCLFSLVRAAGAAFAIFACTLALSPTMHGSAVYTGGAHARAPPPLAMHRRPCAGGPRRTERRHEGRGSVRDDATPAAAGSVLLFKDSFTRASPSCAETAKVPRPAMHLHVVGLQVLTRCRQCTFNSGS